MPTTGFKLYRQLGQFEFVELNEDDDSLGEEIPPENGLFKLINPIFKNSMSTASLKYQSLFPTTYKNGLLLEKM